jgi:hypothetical protein
MLEQPDLMPSAPMNQWIQGILLFDFELIHVPATSFKGPDALSRRRPTTEEQQEAGDEPYDNTWLDDITLLARLPIEPEKKVSDLETSVMPVMEAPTRKETSQDRTLKHIYQMLINGELPNREFKKSTRTKTIYAESSRVLYLGWKDVQTTWKWHTIVSDIQ